MTFITELRPVSVEIQRHRADAGGVKGEVLIAEASTDQRNGRPRGSFHTAL